MFDRTVGVSEVAGREALEAVLGGFCSSDAHALLSSWFKP